MAERAYFLIKLEEGASQDEFVEKVLNLEGEQGEIEALDPVMGEYDFVLAMEAEMGPRELEENLKTKVGGIEELTTLKVFGLQKKAKGAEEKLKSMMAE